MAENYDPYYDFRKRLVDAVARDMTGPSPAEEPTEAERLLSEAPISRYIAGVLFPRSAEGIDPEIYDGDGSEEDAETGPADPPVALANVQYPSSMGISFAVDADRCEALAVEIAAVQFEEPPKKKKGSDDDSAGAEGWRRTVVQADFIGPQALPLSDGPGDLRKPVADGLELFIRIRPQDAQGSIPVTIGLINVNTWKSGEGLKDPLSFFHPTICVRDAAGAPNFVARPSNRAGVDDQDLEAYALLYRDAVELATGHGCAVEWDTDGADVRRGVELRSTFMPTYDLRLSDSNSTIVSDWLSMLKIARSDRESACAGMESFCDAYGDWIRVQYDEAESLESGLKVTAKQHLERCDEAVDRMRAGAALLRNDDAAWRAFRLANEAMAVQRARSLYVGGKTESQEADEQHAWRPFQLAFFLLCLTGVADETTPDRGVADLLWFPTGGGKTEAYLGLIAFTLFHRRLRCTDPDKGAGISVIMRYTLRLLTLQQFERAAALICACEVIRRRETGLGEKAMSIGLWVGQASTPNTLDDARKKLDKIRAGQEVREGNPIQVRQCPWCGAKLKAKNYWIRDVDRRMVINKCSKGCEFYDELPIYLVDEDVYQRHPSLIISTADKFASLPWREQAASLFNRDTPGVRPPDLIVQDELHLISGPLGTLAGLYETAVDALCEADGCRPKVIASTATIRRAADQVSGLFQRDVRQFPPPALDARDSYFAVEVGPDRKATRFYVGLMAPGTSQTTLLVRTYAALLQYVRELDAPDDVKDPYWTLLGYFNSLRLLSGARLQVQDDVPDRISVLARRADADERDPEKVIEMTSREPSANIPIHLKDMARRYPDEETVDVILATNMISVGVDIDRLGLMAVMGQPQSTSEYIQATSRVGRAYPGLVFTMFNSARSRDRSHYESFVAYHSALYRQVESTSVTPFSSRARGRGLHAVLVALARLTVDGMLDNRAAGNVDDLELRLAPVVERIVERVSAVAEDEAEDTRAELQQLIRDWIMLAEENGGKLQYRSKHRDDSLLVEAAKEEDGETNPRQFASLWSLRDVDRESNLYLVAEESSES